MKEAKELSILFPQIFDLIGKNFKSMMPKDKEKFTHTDMRILNALNEAEGKLLMHELAESLGVTKGTLTTTIKRVLEKNYCKREKSKEDSRKVYVCLTAKGKNFIKRQYKYLETNLEHLLSQLTKAERKDFLDSYRKIFQILMKFKGREE